MAEPLSAVFRRPFAEQVAAFRLRLGNLVPTARWDDVEAAMRDRAWWVAGAMKADLLADLAAAVDKANAQGTSLEEFRRDFRRIVEERGWHGWTGEGTKAGEAWRTRVIYRTNARVSYAAGRHAQLVEGGFPFWVYFHGGSAEPRLHHLSWDGIVLPADHPFWQTHYPPSGWGCSCYVSGARSLRAARRLGGDPDKPLPPGWDSRDPRTGTPPGIQKGWDYAPGASVVEEVSILARKLRDLPTPLGSDLGAASAAAIDAGWAAWLADTAAGRAHEPAVLGSLSRSVLDALAGRAIRPQSAEVMILPGLVTGPKARRHEEKGDALTPEDWGELPSLFRSPVAVFLDLRSGRLLYVLRRNDRVPQLALDFEFGAIGDREYVNMIVSAYRPRRADLEARLRGEQIALLIGGLE